MTTLKQVIFAISALACAACTQLVTEERPGQTVDETFQGFPMTWTDGNQMTFAYKVYDDQGLLGICGAFAEQPSTPQSADRFNDLMRQSMYLVMDDEVLINDISFFKKAGFERDALPFGQAACRRTDEPWNPDHAEAALTLASSRRSFTIYD